MNKELEDHLNYLREDYYVREGTFFSHFFCPILFKDEDVELCKAHVINKAFSESSRTWIAQRADVDNFYGGHFEGDFLDTKVFGSMSLTDILLDKDLSKKFQSRLLVDGQPIDFFFGKKEIPDQFTPIFIKGKKTSVPIGLKVAPSDIDVLAGKNWEIEVFRDIRIAVMVSLIKAAHLTLFKMLGYRYVSSSMGIHVGNDLLGRFFLNNHDKPKAEVVENAKSFFRDYVNIARPLISSEVDFKGTVTDGKFYVWMGTSGKPWAITVFIKAGHIIWSVLLPTLQDPDQADTYLSFLKNSTTDVQVTLGQFKDGTWQMQEGTSPMIWPKNDVWPS